MLELDPAAAMEKRLAKRALANAVAKGMEMRDGVTVAELDEKTDGAFFPALVPTAAVIMLVCAHPA